MARSSAGALGGDVLGGLQAELSHIGNRAADLSGASSVLFLLLPVNLPEGRSPAGQLGLASVPKGISDAPRRQHLRLVVSGFLCAGAQPRAAGSLAVENCQGARRSEERRV